VHELLSSRRIAKAVATLLNVNFKTVIKRTDSRQRANSVSRTSRSSHTKLRTFSYRATALRSGILLANTQMSVLYQKVPYVELD
jgi:hypothetical protein